MAQTVAFISGFETGDASELLNFGAGASVQGTIVRTGGYALKQELTASRPNVTLAAIQSVFRFYLRVPALPSALVTIATEVSSLPGNRLRLRTSATNKLVVTDVSGATLGLTTTTGTFTLGIDTWYRIEIFLDLAAGGVVKVLVDGVTDINTTHTNDVSATTTKTYDLTGAATPNEYFYDDIRIDKGGVTAIGAGQCIARQGLAGTPTYDAWTKTGAATADACWSDTPFTTGT